MLMRSCLDQSFTVSAAGFDVNSSLVKINQKAEREVAHFWRVYKGSHFFKFFVYFNDQHSWTTHTLMYANKIMTNGVTGKVSFWLHCPKNQLNY